LGDRIAGRIAEETKAMGPLRRYIERRRVLRLLAELERTLGTRPRTTGLGLASHGTARRRSALR